MKKIDFAAILTNTGAAVAGGVAGGMLKKITAVNEVVTSGAGILLGAALPIIAPKSEMLKSFGAGLAASAGRSLVTHFVPSIGDAEMNDGAVGAEEMNDGAVGLSDDAVSAVYAEEEQPVEEVNGVEVAEDLDD
jgi:hypothetical protein